MPRRPQLPKSVSIQVEAYVPRTYIKDGIERQSKRRHLAWVTVGRARLLYADKKSIFVRQFGSDALYRADGSMNLAGHKPDHPSAKKIPFQHGWWRVHPDSIKALRGC